MQLWVISSGEYNDFNNHFVTDNAEIVDLAIKSNDFVVQEFDTEDAIKYFKEGKRTYFFRKQFSGKVSATEYGLPDSNARLVYKEYLWNRSVCVFPILASSKEEAIEIGINLLEKHLRWKEENG